MLTAENSAAQSCRIASEADLLRVRQLLRENSRELGLVDQTKFVTAGSELARNILKYAAGAGGVLQIQSVAQDRKRGVRASFVDHGPGIPDLSLAMRDGYSTGGSLGLGLPGARRLVDEFSIESVVNEGTTVTIVKWIR